MLRNMRSIRRYALLRPTELAELAELSERHEELVRQLEAHEQHASAQHIPGLEPLNLEPRDLEIEIRQVRQETLKALARISRSIENLREK